MKMSPHERSRQRRLGTKKIFDSLPGGDTRRGSKNRQRIDKKIKRRREEQERRREERERRERERQIIHEISIEVFAFAIKSGLPVSRLNLLDMTSSQKKFSFVSKIGASLKPLCSIISFDNFS